MKKILIIMMAVTVAASFTFVSCSKDGSETKEKEKITYGDERGQTTCPVMGNPVNKDVYVDYEGKRIYFCCEGCIEKFKENPEKYMEKLEGVKLDDAPDTSS